MLDSQRLKLRFGPYRTPKLKYGARVMDAIRGEVEIVGLHDGPIPWPIGKRGHIRAIVLYGDLVKALRREAGVAVQHWWNVGPTTVNKWRRALRIVGQPTACTLGVIAALHQGNVGRRASAETRRKMSESHRKRGTRPPNIGPAWTAEEDAMCRTLRPVEIVQRTGRSFSAVKWRRRVLGLPDGRRRENRMAAPLEASASPRRSGAV